MLWTTAGARGGRDVGEPICAAYGGEMCRDTIDRGRARGENECEQCWQGTLNGAQLLAELPKCAKHGKHARSNSTICLASMTSKAGSATFTMPPHMGVA